MAIPSNVISHSLTLEFECPEVKKDTTVTVNHPSICHGQYFEDWTYEYVIVKCPLCGRSHSVEV